MPSRALTDLYERYGTRLMPACRRVDIDTLRSARTPPKRQNARPERSPNRRRGPTRSAHRAFSSRIALSRLDAPDCPLWPAYGRCSAGGAGDEGGDDVGGVSVE